MAVREKPQSLRYLQWRGRSLAKLEKYADAISDFSEIIRLDPENSRAYHSRGVAYESLGNVELAVEDWETTINIEGEKRVIWWQTDLKKRGFYDGKVNGVYDQQMKKHLIACATNPQC